MDMSSGDWLSHLAMEDSATMINHCQMMLSSQTNYGDTHINIFDPSEVLLVNSNPQLIARKENGEKELINGEHNNNNNREWNSYTSLTNSSSLLISFGSTESDDNMNSIIKPKEEPVQFGDHGSTSTTNDALINNSSAHTPDKRVALCSKEHVLAERKRRETMTQRFHTLSNLIPGLKKADKATILGDAANHLKQLEERIKTLEEQTCKRTVESVVLVNSTSRQDRNADSSSSFSSKEKLNSDVNTILDIEARASKNSLLIRIHCENDQGVVQKVLNEMEKLHLTTLNCNTMPFGGYAMNITLIAQMEDAFPMTIKDVVANLRRALKQFFDLKK